MLKWLPVVMNVEVGSCSNECFDTGVVVTNVVKMSPVCVCVVAGGTGHHVYDGPAHEAQENRNHRLVHLTVHSRSFMKSA